MDKREEFSVHHTDPVQDAQSAATQATPEASSATAGGEPVTPEHQLGLALPAGVVTGSSSCSGRGSGGGGAACWTLSALVLVPLLVQRDGGRRVLKSRTEELVCIWG